MNKSADKPDAANPLEARLAELQSALRVRNPEDIAFQIGGEYIRQKSERAEILTALWNAPVTISYPDLVVVNINGEALPPHFQALILYYCHIADGVELENRWVSFADLPDGRMYNYAFQGYSGDKIKKTFGQDVDSIKKACLATGGQSSVGGNVAFRFTPLPRVPILINYWLGDEDFPSTCKILFDASATHYLPIDVCAILGGMLASRVVKFASCA